MPPIELRPLGNTGIRVSPVALGCWPISGMTSLDVNEADSLATLHAAIDAGINFFDTAYAYGAARRERAADRPGDRRPPRRGGDRHQRRHPLGRRRPASHRRPAGRRSAASAKKASAGWAPTASSCSICTRPIPTRRWPNRPAALLRLQARRQDAVGRRLELHAAAARGVSRGLPASPPFSRPTTCCSATSSGTRCPGAASGASPSASIGR